MATLNTLRTRGALILTIFIGLALLAFLLQDLTNASSVFQSRRNRVGSINGNHISYQEFVAASDNLNKIVQMLYNRNSLTSEEMDQVRNMVWESYIHQYAFIPGFRRMGLMVWEEEQVDMIRGNFISPVIRSMFTSPETRMFDPAIVEGFIANLDYDKTGAMSAVWDHIKKEMVDDRMMSKYMAAVQNGLFVNDLEVAQGVRAANNAFNGRYVTIPFSQVADSLVPVRSSEIRRYFNRHRDRFKQAASRDIEYVVFDLFPSERDLAEAAATVEKIAAEFAAAESPMQFASLNSQERTEPRFLREDQLPTELAAIAFGARKGELAGPTLKGNTYTISRVADERMMPDSVGARHILLSRTQAASADSIINAIKGGKSIFDLAPMYSIDTAVDLGTFPPEMMVQEFANAVSEAKKGDVFSVETQYGTHVVEMTYRAQPVRKVQIATITYHIEPSAATQQGVYNQAREFLTLAAGSRENFDNAVEQSGVSRRVATIADSDRDVRGLSDSRELVRWSFNSKQGAVSGILDIDGNYVVAVLTGARNAGIADIRDVSSDIAQRLRQDKKAAILTERMAGRSFEEVAAMEGAREGELAGVRFSAFYIPDLGVEHAVIGALGALSEGSVSTPVKGSSGVFLVAVDSIEVTEEATDASERVRLEANAQTSLPQRVMQALKEESDIIDNRAKFF